jgi:hypothetical protein
MLSGKKIHKCKTPIRFQANSKKKNTIAVPISVAASARRFLMNKTGTQSSKEMKTFQGIIVIAKSISGGISPRIILVSIKFTSLGKNPAQ